MPRRRRRRAEADALLGEVRLPQLRHLDPRAGAADLLLQLAPRRLRPLPRARLSARDRPRARRPRPDPLAGRGGAAALAARPLALLEAGRRGGRGGQRDRRRHALAGAHRRRARSLPHGTGEERHKVSYRNRFGRRRSYAVRFEGILANLERRFEDTDSENVRERIEGYMAEQPCPQCEGARLRPESLAVTIGGMNIDEFSQLSARAAHNGSTSWS